tara:strand:+ start:55 stop:522 length:468 start_codon:yes stop_codon:yes gene_type:complete
MANKLTLTIIVSIILTVIIISLVNVGVSLFLEQPEWEDYCEASIDKMRFSPEATDEERLALDKEQEECREEYEDALKPYNQIRYYIFAGIGFILLLVGLFAKENMIQLTSLASGGILVTQGIVMNFENKTIVFISLIAILAVFGIIAYRIINKKD